jgi:uncharacterized repeat protein (TIGR02543 family)
LNSGIQQAGAPTSYNGTQLPLTLPTPTRSGFNFQGWYESSIFSGSPINQIPANTISNKSYFAKWTENISLSNNYILTTDYNGGLGTNPSSFSNNSFPLNISNPTRSGYIFEGWTIQYSNGQSIKPYTDLVIISINNGKLSGIIYAPHSTPDADAIINIDNGHYYKIIEQNLSWNKAKEFAESKNGYLATVTSKEEQEFLENIGQGKSLWLGGTDSEVEGTWKWITGEPFNYANWLAGEPNNQNNSEHFLVMWPKTWNDLRNESSEQGGFIVEWNRLNRVNSDNEIVLIANWKNG